MISRIKQDLEFLYKVTRNGAILGGLYFISLVVTSSSISWEICKPALIFLGFYVLTESAKHYGLDRKMIKKYRESKKGSLTLLY